jgi:hypothetical protein
MTRRDLITGVLTGQIIIKPGGGGAGIAAGSDAVLNSLTIGSPANAAQTGDIRLADQGRIKWRATNGVSDAIGMEASFDGCVIAPVGFGYVSIGTNFVQPGQDNSATLGQATARWQKVFCTYIAPIETTFAALPANPTVGALANISDSTVNTAGSTVVGGGTNHVLARYNGTIWKVVAA